MIFLLEDDDSIRKLLDYTLKTQGYDILSFAQPSEFWKTLKTSTQRPNLILLDIMLPQEDGISILKKLRQDEKTSKIPVIMLTARDSEFDVVNGLDSGADDYVTKPFGMMTLLSRIKAVLRRSEKNESKKEESEFSVENIKVNTEKHTVFVDDRQIFLTLKEFDLLVILMKNRGNVLTRERLLDSIWKISTEIESRTVDVHIRTLRQKIGDDEGRILKTVRGIGYKID